MDKSTIRILKELEESFNKLLDTFDRETILQEIFQNFNQLNILLGNKHLSEIDFWYYTPNALIWTNNNEENIENLSDIWSYLDLLNEEGVFSYEFEAHTGEEAFDYLTQDLDGETLDYLESIGAINMERVIEYRSEYKGSFDNGYYDNNDANPIEIKSLKPPLLDIVSVEELLKNPERFPKAKKIQQRI